ncbi:MAG: (2Fe-2S)-binding protein [Leptonema sp. (in: Bacteria)]|nr:(2Fe-2S)-binding protein [Leptonema sp. (in: bacteria)]
MIKMTIDGREVEVPEGTNVLEACLSNEVKLEHFCYHRYLPVDGNCRTCQVEVETPRGRQLTIGCNLKAAEGMVVHTKSEVAQTAQRSALEFLLVDHPLDCPICDKAGECKLQDHYLEYGRYDARRIVPRYFKEDKVIDAGDHIVLDAERCVLCTRCIRFLDNIPGTSELGIIRRGHEAKITTFPGRPISNDYSGNISDVCPVGALTLKEFRFQQRVWLLKKTKSVCQGCARGCTMRIEHNRNKVWRLMPNENPHLNRTWMCDDGRFSFTRFHENRLFKPMLKGTEVSFDQSTLAIQEIISKANPSKVGTIVCGSSSLETMYAAKTMFEKLGNSNIAVYIPSPTLKQDNVLKLASPASNEQGAHFLGMSTDAESIAKKVASGEIETLFVIESDLLGGLDKAKFTGIEKAKSLIVLAHKNTETAKVADVALPVRSFIETNGTYINATSLLQSALKAYEPNNGDLILAASNMVGEIATLLGFENFRYEDPTAFFDLLKTNYDEIRDFKFKKLPEVGVQLKLKPIGPAPFQDMQVDFNIFQEDKRGVTL